MNGEDNKFRGPRSFLPTPEELAANLWSEVNALKGAISMPARTRPWQKTMEFVDGLQGKLPDEEYAVIKRYVEKRSRQAAQVTVTPVGTVQYCSPRPQTPKPSSNVHVNMEENNEGWMNPERDELESPSTGTGFETPGQQCHPIWETGRTTTDGFLTAGSNQGGDISSPTERVKTRAGTKITTTSADISSPTEHVGTRAGTAATPAKPRRNTTSEENKQFNPGGKGEKAPLWNAAVMVVVFSFPGENAGPGVPVVFALCSFVFVCLSTCSVFYLLFLSGDHF